MAVSVVNQSVGVPDICEVPARPCVIIIFGAAGDLTKRKLIPALYNLHLNRQLPENFAIIGLARADKNDEIFRQELAAAMQEYTTAKLDDKQWQWLEQRTYYLQGNFENPESYKNLSDLLQTVDQKHGTQGNYLFYLATAENYFETIVEQISNVHLHRGNGDQWRHFVIEKPFGSDLESAHKLNKKLLSILKEDQIYRIDHYLGKETVQNILVFRFGNGIFEPAWNNHYIDHVQITVAETVGVESRGGFYEKAGTLRDMIPNHLFQLLSFIAMEPPNTFDADAVRTKKAEVINAVRPLTHDDVRLNVIRGQYDSGEVDDQPVQAYRKENRVATDSYVETFVAMKLMIDNWRWVGVPFYLRSGKRLAKRTTEISIQFKSPPLCLFRNTTVSELVPNYLIMHIQPHEGISLQFGAKTPGALLQIGRVQMDFNYQDYFGPSPSTGYETLIYDCMLGDQTLFQRDDNVEAGWRVVEPIQQVWSVEKPTDFPNYSAGSWGPQSAHQLLIRDGRQWRI